MPTPNGELPATGRTIRTTSISMLTFADGMVISEHVYSDQLELLTQLGLAASR
jgi:predicted ester cyclase